MSNYRFILIDEFGGPCRKFANKMEAAPYLTSGMTLVALPKGPSLYEQALLTLQEALL